MRKLENLLVILFTVFLFSGCDKIPFMDTAKPVKQIKQNLPPVGETIVAKVGDFYITASDLNKEVDNFNSLASAQKMDKNKIDTSEKKVKYLRDELVRKYILYQEALDRGLDKKPEIAKELEAAKMNLLIAELLRREIEKIDVSSKEIEDFYEQNKDMLRDPEQRKILEIMTPTEEEAKQVYIELLKGMDFSSLARQYSKANTASRGGDVGLMTYEVSPEKRIRPEKFYEVAFSPSLEVGGVSSIFKGPDGFYIIKLDSIKKSEPKSLAELRDNIKSWLLFEKQQKAIVELANKLSGETKIEIYEEKVR
ncbi:MAG: peptidyl-prolyl cis-trans isomerase [Candidatus Omnitrophica bacterium]|nr:peptidyl-prolyl cis-trans isomerase [Candidatus Omnitrophota bacterium]